MFMAGRGQEGQRSIRNPGAKGTNYIRNLCIVSPHGTVGLFYLCVLGLI